MGRQRKMAVLVTLGLLVLSFETTQGQKFKQLSGTAGQAVILSCGSSRDGCSWNKDGIRLSLEERSDQARFSVSCCDLSIEPLLPGDEGKYDCNNGQSRHHLRVLVEAGVPYIEEGRQSTVHDVQEGRQAELHCVSQGGRPAAEIEWRRDGQPVNELDRIFEEVTRAGDGWRTRSTFTFRPLVATNVTCSASNEAVIEPRVSSALEGRVRGRPRVEVKVDQDVVREGDSFEVLCKSSAYPQDVGYRWFFSGAELEGMTDNALLIEEISRMYDQADITCLVENEEGEGQGSTQLDVQFPPTILLHPRSQVAKRKDNVTFHCVAEGNPVPSYIWTVERRDSLLQAGTQNLSLVETEKWTSLGQDVILECATRAVSNRTRLVWLRSTGGKAKDLDPVEEGGRLEVVTQYKDWQRTSRLLIKKLEVGDIGEYACFAENQVGTDLGMIQLKLKSGVDILSVIAGITCIVGVLLLAAIFIYIRLKKRCCAKVPDEKC